MHICFLNPPGEYYSPQSGGAIATIIMEMARKLLSRGHRVSIVTSVNGDDIYSIGEILPIAIPTRKDMGLLARAVSSLRRRLNGWDWPYYEYYRDATVATVRRLQPDAVILFNDLVSSKYLRCALPRARIAVWLQNEWRTNYRDLHRSVAATDVYLTCSYYIRLWTSRTHGIPTERFIIAPSGIDLEAFKPRTSFLKATPELRVLFIGRIDPNKGPDIAADAVAALRRRGVNIQLTVAGGLWWYGHGREMDNPFFRQLKEKMEAAHACYLGHVPRSGVPELLRAHDVVCVLSRSNEPFALVVLEAMASGCAVVASNRGGLPESCGGAALLVDPEDMNAVEDRLESLARTPALLQRQKRRSIERAARAPWSACAEIVEKALTEK